MQRIQALHSRAYPFVFHVPFGGQVCIDHFPYPWMNEKRLHNLFIIILQGVSSRWHIDAPSQFTIAPLSNTLAVLYSPSYICHFPTVPVCYMTLHWYSVMGSFHLDNSYRQVRNCPQKLFRLWCMVGTSDGCICVAECFTVSFNDKANLFTANQSDI